ncbi:cytochrome P450 [Acidimicrobiaceae bacterium]|nr:cytochrome P450 [Acidimicrobiaceae bacterium]
MKAPVVGSPPVVGHSIQFNYDALALIQRLQKSKGDVFQLNILNEDVLLFLTPSATKQIFLDPDDNFSSKHGWEFSIGPTFENGLMLRDFDDHKYHRSLLQNSFRRDALDKYIHIIQPRIDSWIEEVKQKREFNLYKSIKQLMFNVAVELFFDEVDDTKLNHLNQLFINSIKPATTIVRSPYPMTRMKKGLKARVELLEYFQEKSDKIDLSKETLFADLVKTNNEEAGLTNFEIAEHMIFLLLAAHDTTTSTLTSSIHFLAGDENYQNKVKTESSTLSKTDISDLKNGIIGEALFNEAIRKYPPVPFSPRWVVRDTELDGYEIPKNTYIAAGPLVLHNDERYWEDPLAFNPERFEDPTITHEAYFPFAGGAHTCLGKFFASYLFKNVIYKLVDNFQVISTTEELKINPAPIPNPRKDVKIQVS